MLQHVSMAAPTTGLPGKPALHFQGLRPVEAPLLRFAGAAPRRTQIVASLGPASTSAPVLERMIDAGADVFRIDFAKGDTQQHAQTVATVRQVTEQMRAAGRLNRPIRLMADLQGPRIAVGQTPEQTLRAGEGVRLCSGQRPVAGAIPLTYPALLASAKPGERLILDDGRLVLQVKSPVDATGALNAEVLKGGTLKSGMLINAPDTALSGSALTEKDRADLAFALTQGFEIITQSFPASDADVAETRRLIRAHRPAASPLLIAKIERPQAVEPAMLQKIAQAADALMVARGDLATEMGLVKLPALQQRITEAAHQAGKPVVVANKLLGSMTHTDQPGRSDVFDLADAVRRGADMVMLTGETAVGQYPAEAVGMAREIIEAYEPAPKTGVPAMLEGLQKLAHTWVDRLFALLAQRVEAAWGKLMALFGGAE